MNTIIELAQQLGEAISSSDQAATLRTVRTEMAAQEGLVQTMNEYQQQMDKLTQLEKEGATIEVDDKHKLRDLHGRLISDPVYKKFNEAQMEYIDLMRKVNEAMQTKLQETEEG
jgi:cell fate (sporulation/competence/biofilm development) regulator YlbF (YheA/YmcA/DUF963 family)